MKRVSTALLAALLACASAATASAKVRKQTYGVGMDFIIAGTTVKAGTYRFVFDDKTNELTVIDKKTKEVVARAEARLEPQEKGLARFIGLRLVGGSNPRALDAVAFERNSFIRIGASAARQ